MQPTRRIASSSFVRKAFSLYGYGKYPQTASPSISLAGKTVSDDLQSDRILDTTGKIAKGVIAAEYASANKSRRRARRR